MRSKPPRPLSKTARNERRKLTGTGLNALAVALIGLGVLQPFVTQGEVNPYRVALWVFLGFALHMLARQAVAGLED